MIKAQYETRGPVPQDVIEAVSFDKPSLETGEVLLEVLAAPINPSDVLTLTGEYGMLPPLPAIGGNEGVGKVAELGPGAEGLSLGQVVLLPVGSGTWSTHLVAKASALIPLPGGADPKQLSMLTINPPTALLLLRDFVDLQPGDWVIQNAANSGVGGYVHQLAKQKGFKSIGLVRRESAVAAVKESGADVVLVDGEKLEERVAEATGGAKVRLGIDAVGGSATGRMSNCLCSGATLVAYGAMSGEPCSVSSGTLIFKGLTLKGFWLAKWLRAATNEERMGVFGELAQGIAKGSLHARIHATYDVSQIKEAVAAANAGERDGKILIVPGS